MKTPAHQRKQPGWLTQPVLPLQQSGQEHAEEKLLSVSPLASAGYDFSCIPLRAAAQPDIIVSQPGERNEREAEWLADRIVNNPATHTEQQTSGGTHESKGESQPGASATLLPDLSKFPGEAREVLQSTGQPLEEPVRNIMEPRFGHDFRNVRVHRDQQAAATARDAFANAYTVGSHMVFGEGQYAPATHTGRRLLAHELTHVLLSQNSTVPLLQRETARELVARYTDEHLYGDTIHMGDLANELARRIRARQYDFVRQVILDGLGYSDRDDVSLALLNLLSIPELIQAARDSASVPLFQTMADELHSGWNTEEEDNKVMLLNAVLSDGPDRLIWNRKRIRSLKEQAPTDLEALALLFEDDSLVDEGSVSSRSQSILKATEHSIIPGLQTGMDFGDTGFAGDQQPGGSGFRDPHPASRNQVGHFLTAVGLVIAPEVVSRPLPIFGSVRSMIGAPASMSDQEVALRLTIGHEKRPDPPHGLEILIDIITTGLIERYLADEPEGETEEERDRRVARAIERQINQDIQEVIAAFRAQFQATTDDDIAAWNAALAQLGTGDTLDRSALEGPTSPLNHITIDPSQSGNSQQDLRLSLVGWRLGQLLQSGGFPNRASVARWIRANLGPAPASSGP